MGDFSHKEENFNHHLRKVIDANLGNEQFGVTQLAEEMHMSRSTLYRKIKKTLHLSVSQYICQMRLNRAFSLLLQSSLTISDIAYDCGFHSVPYFSKCFHKWYGIPPHKVREGNLTGSRPPFKHPDHSPLSSFLKPKK